MKKQKRTVSFILALSMALMTQSCTAKDDTSPETTEPSSQTDETDGTAEESADTEVETEPFDMPPETDELVVYSNSMTRSVLTAAVNIFKDKYPDVEVTYENVSDDAYEELLKTELAAGAGPDVVFTLDSYINDVYKLMLSNIFMNLDGFMDNDDSFNKDDYIKGVFDSGVLKGKRYFTPIEFNAHSVLTTQEILDEEGLKLEDIKTFNGYIDSIYNYNQKYADDPDKSALFHSIYMYPDTNEAEKLIDYFGSTYIDYENSIVKINDTEKDDFRTLMDGARKIYGFDIVESFQMGHDDEALAAHNCLYSDMIDIGAGLIVPQLCHSLVEAEKTPVIFLPQNPDGTVTGNIYSFAAIPEGADNKLNAYRFLKILLSDEFQGGEGDSRETRLAYLTKCPVRKDAIYKHITSWVDDYDNQDYVKAEEMCVEVMMSVDNAVLVPKQCRKYVVQNMLPYITGEKEWDECFDKLINVLELYKDE